jgi:membrane protease YdiL (CAAX protease family)
MASDRSTSETSPTSTEPRHRPARLLAACRRRLVTEPMRLAERDPPSSGDDQPASDAEPRLDLQVAVVFVTAAVALTLLEYLVKGGPAGGHARLANYRAAVGLDTLADRLRWAMTDSPAHQFNDLAYFALGCSTCYFLLPALVIKLVFRQRLADYGLKLRGAFKDVWMYGLMLSAVVPAVIAVSFTAPFQTRYPFYKLGPGESFWPHFVLWELLYALQFVALEFFFRGFLVHGTRRQLGYYSIFAMTVPYCMIHFGKPMLETFAAIIAGIVLGIMSLRTRSVWMGAALHITVAWLMDALALWHKGLLF